MKNRVLDPNISKIFVKNCKKKQSENFKYFFFNFGQLIFYKNKKEKKRHFGFGSQSSSGFDPSNRPDPRFKKKPYLEPQLFLNYLVKHSNQTGYTKLSLHLKKGIGVSYKKVYITSKQQRVLGQRLCKTWQFDFFVLLP